MAERLNIPNGTVFGRLKVITEDTPHVYPSGKSRRAFKCECDCGDVSTYLVNRLRSGHTRSCGCYVLEKNTTHGMHATRQYKIWTGMKLRCTNPKDTAYYAYGAKGISYCTSWEVFENFWKDMEEGYAENLTLDRIDNSLGYCKDNCRWETNSVQMFNRKVSTDSSSGKAGVTWHGKNSKWVVRINVGRRCIYLGYYADVATAIRIREAAEIKYYGFITETGNPNKEANY